MELIQCSIFQTFLGKAVDIPRKSKKFFDGWIKCCRRGKHQINETSFTRAPGTNQGHKQTIIGENDLVHSLGLGRM